VDRGDDVSTIEPDATTDPYFTDGDLSAIEVAERLRRMEEKQDRILEKIAATEELIARVIEEVKPTVDELMNSSLVKMLGVGKKK
jgi:uncharacterized Fe-S cluster-containing radical SAM superfamily protein